MIKVDQSMLISRLQESLQSLPIRLQHGFTLIELMIVITIMGVIFGGGTASYRRLERRQSVTNVCNELKQMALTAQKRARVGDRPPSCARLNSYRVRRISTVPYTVRLEALCLNSVGAAVILTVEDVAFPTRVSVPTFDTMTFRVLHGGLVETSAAVTAQSSSPNYRCQFTVDGGGSITPTTTSTF